jgi:hypothetical protein
MKQTYCVILLLLVVIPTIGQDRKPDGVCPVEITYDRGADTTTVKCGLVESVGATGRLIVQANATFQGREPNGTTMFRLGLSSYKGGATRHTQPLFKEATTLYLSVDSAQMEIPIKDYGSDFFEMNRLLAERAHAEISREDLQKLLDTRSLVGRWGGVEFKLSDSALASLKSFISRQIFAVNGH